MSDKDKTGEVRKRRREAARRALADAEARRRQAEAGESAPREIGGRNGPDPTRHGDWEKDGLATDF